MRRSCCALRTCRKIYRCFFIRTWGLRLRRVQLGLRRAHLLVHPLHVCLQLAKLSLLCQLRLASILALLLGPPERVEQVQ